MSKNKKKTKYLIHEIDHRGLSVPAISFPWPDGKRLRRRVGDEEATKDLIAACVYQVHHGDWVAYRKELEERLRKGVSENAKAEGDISIAEAAKIFCDWAKTRHDSDFYEKNLRPVVRIVGDRRLQSFSRDDGNYFYNTRLEDIAETGVHKGEKITVCTANHSFTALSALLDFCLTEKKWIKTHPTADFKWKTPKKKKRFPLEDVDVHRLVEEAMKIDDPLGRCFGIMGQTGVRFEEAMTIERLLWDVAGEQLILRASKKNENGREIPLTPEALKLAAGLPKEGRFNKFLFVDLRSNTRYNRSYVISVFERARIAAGIPFAIRPHDLRHFRCITWLENGNDIEAVRQWMGHRNIATTQIYLQYVKHRATPAFKEADQREVAKLNAKLNARREEAL